VTTRDHVHANPPPASRYRQTLEQVARRAAAGEDLRVAVREFLDEFAMRPDDALRVAALEAEPPLVDARADALLGALAEHLARAHRLAIPAWAADPKRFLDVMWFLSDVPTFRPTALRESPAAFRRRGIFVARGFLERV
jgi:hypothetical protein